VVADNYVDFLVPRPDEGDCVGRWVGKILTFHAFQFVSFDFSALSHRP